jgi:hypothetical protein
LVTSIHPGILLGRQAGLDVRLDTFPCRIPHCLELGILSSRTIAGSWYCRSTRSKKTTGSVWTTRRNERRRSARVRVLLRCFHTRLFPALRPALHHSIHSHACHQSPEHGFNIPCEPSLPSGWHLLEHDHIPWLQLIAFSTSYPAITVANASVGGYMACLHHFGH